MRRAVVDHKRRKPYEHRLVCSSPDAEDCHIVVIARHHHDRTDDVSREREREDLWLSMDSTLFLRCILHCIARKLLWFGVTRLA
jgi:hypothetical protein